MAPTTQTIILDHFRGMKTRLFIRAKAASQWPLADWVGLFLALILLFLSALAIHLIPIGRCFTYLGKSLGAVACIPLGNPAQITRARLVRRSLRRAALLSPLRADCLPQALAGLLMSRCLAIPVTAHLGLALSPAESGQTPQHLGQLSAHAWLCCGPIRISGGYSFDSYAPVACFIAVPANGLAKP